MLPKDNGSVMRRLQRNEIVLCSDQLYEQVRAISAKFGLDSGRLLDSIARGIVHKPTKFHFHPIKNIENGYIAPIEHVEEGVFKVFEVVFYYNEHPRPGIEKYQLIGVVEQ